MINSILSVSLLLFATDAAAAGADDAYAHEYFSECCYYYLPEKIQKENAINGRKFI